MQIWLPAVKSFCKNDSHRHIENISKHIRTKTEPLIKCFGYAFLKLKYNFPFIFFFFFFHVLFVSVSKCARQMTTPSTHINTRVVFGSQATEGRNIFSLLHNFILLFFSIQDMMNRLFVVLLHSNSSFRNQTFKVTREKLFRVVSLIEQK